jgi:hypothetical protein
MSMSTSSTIFHIGALVWQAGIAVAAGLDAMWTGLPAAAFAVVWLAAVAGPILPARVRRPASAQLGAMLIAGGLGLLIGIVLCRIAPTGRLSAECLSFGMLCAIFAVVAALPAAVRFAGEDSVVFAPRTASATV